MIMAALNRRYNRESGIEEWLYSARSARPRLENAGVSENVAADIFGYEKARITYGLYSGEANLEVKMEALAKLRY